MRGRGGGGDGARTAADSRERTLSLQTFHELRVRDLKLAVLHRVARGEPVLCAACGRQHVGQHRCQAIQGLCVRSDSEPGYFAGAMYISYALSVPMMAVLTMLVRFVAPDWPLGRSVLVAALFFLPLVPAVFRYSRILWIHLDRGIDPE